MRRAGAICNPGASWLVRDPDTKARLGVIYERKLGEQLYGADAPDHTPWGEVPGADRGVRRGRLRRRRRAGQTALDASTFPGGAEPAAGGAGARARHRAHHPLEAVRGRATPAPRPAGRRLRPREHSTRTGWPAARFGPTTRRPMHEVTYRERYGEAWS